VSSVASRGERANRAGTPRYRVPKNPEPDEEARAPSASRAPRADRTGALREPLPLGRTSEIGESLLGDEVVELCGHRILPVLLIDQINLGAKRLHYTGRTP
jgi:hypothetical protein